MNKHQAWLALWFQVGMLSYMLKRAYYLITGPNPIASSWTEFIKRCWVPLFIRALIESVLYWALFNAELMTKALTALGWTNWSWGFMMVTQFAPMSFFFGHAIDSITDLAVAKVPGLKDWLPQMPPPLKTIIPAGGEGK